jgi:hypothetical protein
LGGEITLSIRDFREPIMTIICSGGKIAARGISVEDGCFTSRLNITFNTTVLQGRSVRCSVDDGTHASEIGRHILTLSTGTGINFVNTQCTLYIASSTYTLLL